MESKQGKNEFARDLYRKVGLRENGKDLFIEKWITFYHSDVQKTEEHYNSYIQEAIRYYNSAKAYVHKGIIQEYILEKVQSSILGDFDTIKESLYTTKESLDKCLYLLDNPFNEDLDVLCEIKQLKSKLSPKLLKDYS
jgi:hypothetical protein